MASSDRPRQFVHVKEPGGRELFRQRLPSRLLCASGRQERRWKRGGRSEWNHSRADGGNSQLLGRREAYERGEPGDDQPVAACPNFEHLTHPGVRVKSNQGHVQMINTNKKYVLKI